MLAHIPKTLLIPLWGRAHATKQNMPECQDEFALKMMDDAAVDLSELDAMSAFMKKTMILGVAIRTYFFDQAVTDFIKAHPQPVIVNLGCGLDYRSYRLGDKNVTWYNVDVAETHKLRCELLPGSTETLNIHELVGGIDDYSWFDQVKLTEGQDLLLICEGTMMYFNEEIVKSFLTAFKQHFPHHSGYIESVGDLLKGKVHPSVKAVGVNAAFQQGYRRFDQVFQSWFGDVKLHKLDSLFDQRISEWGIIKWLVRLYPPFRYRFSSQMISYQFGG